MHMHTIVFPILSYPHQYLLAIANGTGANGVGEGGDSTVLQRELKPSETSALQLGGTFIACSYLAGVA